MPKLAGQRIVLTVREAASLLGINTQAVYDACYCGELENFRVNRTIRIPREAVDDWIDLLCWRTKVRMLSKSRSRKGA